MGTWCISDDFYNSRCWPIVVSVGVGLFTAWALNDIDEKFGSTDQVVVYIEQAQQDVVEKARQIESGFLDLGAIFVDGLLETGREIIVSELKAYILKALSDINPRSL